jgi:hypothetical protein
LCPLVLPDALPISEAARYGISSTPSFLAGRTGGPLERLELDSLEAGALRPTLDRLLAE